MADAIHGNTQTGPTKQELIAALVQKELKQMAILAPLFTDVSRFAIKGAKSISFPKLTDFTVNLRPSGTKGDAQVVSSTVDTLDLDIPAYIAWIVDTNDEIQSTLDWELELVKKAASAHSRFVDSKIIEALRLFGNEVAATSDITHDIVLEMREFLRKKNGDLNACAFVVAADQETSLLKIEQFTKSDYNAANVVPTGVLGRLYGIPVYVHNELADGEYFLAEKSAIAYGFQKAPAMATQGANEYGAGAERTAMDQLFGVTGLQLGVNGVPANKSCLIIKNKVAVTP